MIRAFEIVRDEELNIFTTEVEDVANHEFLADIRGDYGMGEGLAPFQPMEPQEALNKWLEDLREEEKNWPDGSPVNEQELEAALAEYKAATEGAKGCVVYWSSVEGTDATLTFFFDVTHQDILDLPVQDLED